MAGVHHCMGVMVLAGKRVNECDAPGAVLYDSVTGTVMPILFDSEEQAEGFVRWLGIDPRGMRIGELMSAWELFRQNPKGHYDLADDSFECAPV